MNDPTSMYLSLDSGVDQNLLTSNHRTDFKELFDAVKYFRLPTSELAE